MGGPVRERLLPNAPEAIAEPAIGGGPGQSSGPDAVVRADLPADLTSPGQARAAVRQALAAWGLADLSDDAELLTSELVANAAEHGGGPISLALSRHVEAEGQPGLTCEVTDTSSDLPRFTPAGPDAERGRGLAILSAIAADSGVRPSQTGKTSWFTLAVRDRAARVARQTEPEADLEAGA